MLTDKISRWLLRAVPESGDSLLENHSTALGTDIGLIRKENQDRIAMLKVDSNSPNFPRFTAIALTDGMGGMNNGEECAALAIGSFFNCLISHRNRPPEERLKLAANTANSTVFDFCQGSGGATLSAVIFTDKNRTYTVNVGDSRIYATQPKAQTKLLRLTTDDSLEEAVGGHGRALIQFIGMGEGLDAHTRVVSDNLESLILTSDGVHFIDQAVLSDIALNASTPATSVQQLLAYAKWRGGPDNATAAYVSINKLTEALQEPSPGIEIHDPFGSLIITWTKQDTKGGAALPNKLSTTPPDPKLEPLKPPQKKRPRKATKENTKSSKHEQFEIDVMPTPKDK